MLNDLRLHTGRLDVYVYNEGCYSSHIYMSTEVSTYDLRG